ncbi:MAG: spore coat associated protein CotJA [Clostridia bacterium]|nr:spore coat associated protein CotJA [Clostridia bacterium]
MNNCSCASEFLNTSLSDIEFDEKCSTPSNSAVLARIYVPVQHPGRLYSLCEGLSRGTIYPCLDQPYAGCPCCNAGCDGEDISPDSYICKKEDSRHGKR